MATDRHEKRRASRLARAHAESRILERAETLPPHVFCAIRQADMFTYASVQANAQFHGNGTRERPRATLHEPLVLLL